MPARHRGSVSSIGFIFRLGNNIGTQALFSLTVNCARVFCGLKGECLSAQPYLLIVYDSVRETW